MEVELKTEGKAKRLNAAVAITVVIISVFMAVSKIKDDNIVQAMQAAKADELDTWNEYQAEKVKLHLAEQSVLLAGLQPIASLTSDARAQIDKMRQDATKYDAAANDLATKAKGFQDQYDGLNFHDDQFDLSDAGLAIALSLAAVAALTSLWWLLGVSWLFAAGGIVIGLAGFVGWNIHPDWIVSLLS